jgi:RHH-type transcriptional regulator, proline utilization regulon repressor / proline dehydrogenase / delta 1-pyrroline-5-carboxylate dehydrogenase
MTRTRTQADSDSFPSTGESLRRFVADYAPPDEALIPQLLAETAEDAATEQRITARARRYIIGIREARGGIGGLEDFMHEYSLSTPEGLALMSLAEALLRVPDAATQDRLIEDKLGAGDWEHAAARESESWLVSATTWALGLTARIVHPPETPEGIIRKLAQRLGQPTVRTAARQAMRLLGHQFVLGETIEDALSRAREAGRKGYRHSFDMLGEGARTARDAERYFSAYARAIDAIGKSAVGSLPERPGISVKLSALHPRYVARQRDRVLAELMPRLIELCLAAKAHDLNLTVDAEEADRLELSLEVFAKLLAEPKLSGWEGLGLAVQAYQKRAPQVIDWLSEAASASGRRLMVRLVKGAYWDTEIKRAQERGLADFPVFSRKPATDLCYLACAKRLLAARPRLYPQFATHNALSVATILELAGDENFEFQRLHGMGEALYAQVHEKEGFACRTYAPVGSHKELLAYLVRRLLENGANSSFVNAVNDPAVPVETLLTPPAASFSAGSSARHAKIPLPGQIFGARKNSRGVEFGCRADLSALIVEVDAVALPIADAVPLIGGGERAGRSRAVLSPADGKTVVGTVAEADPSLASTAMESAAAGFDAWEKTPANERAATLERAAELIEANRGRFLALLAHEGGKTLDDGISEIREAADFCRYYAGEARRLFAQETILPGPSGEENRYRLVGRGVFVCISPWNFPLAIFSGQVAAALAAGNSVVAKPAEQTPLVAFEVVKLMHRAGIPVNALNLVPGDGAIGAALVEDPRVAGGAFTGSTEVGQKINRALAAKDGSIVPLIAETGGINAMIADATALPEQVADDVVTSAFRSAGQRCSACRILFVQDDVADTMIEMIAGAAAELRLGDPADPATDVGPVIDGDAKRALEDHLKRMRGEETILFAGRAPEKGNFVAPHIVELRRADTLTKEVFGPILHVVRWRSDRLDDVVESIRRTGYGLTFGIHTRVGGRAERIARALRVGNVYVNRSTIGAVVGSQPFGGMGLSGTGPKAGGPNYLQRFAHEQVVSTDTTAAGGNASLVTMEDSTGPSLGRAKPKAKKL